MFLQTALKLVLCNYCDKLRAVGNSIMSQLNNDNKKRLLDSVVIQPFLSTVLEPPRVKPVFRIIGSLLLHINIHTVNWTKDSESILQSCS